MARLILNNNENFADFPEDDDIAFVNTPSTHVAPSEPAAAPETDRGVMPAAEPAAPQYVEPATPRYVEPATPRRARVAMPQNAEPDQGAIQSQDLYANAFPEWDLLPPQVVIRRVNRKKQQ